MNQWILGSVEDRNQPFGST